MPAKEKDLTSKISGSRRRRRGCRKERLEALSQLGVTSALHGCWPMSSPFLAFVHTFASLFDHADDLVGEKVMFALMADDESFV